MGALTLTPTNPDATLTLAITLTLTTSVYPPLTLTLAITLTCIVYAGQHTALCEQTPADPVLARCSFPLANCRAQLCTGATCF